MANGAFKFKDNSGNVVSFISGSGSNISFSGGTLDLSGMTGLTLGNITLSGTTQNAISASHAASYLLTSSFNTYSSSLATTGSNTFVGTQTLSGSIIPAVNNTYDLGDPTHQFRHVYISSGSLYINGTKVLGSTSQELQITTDVGQSFKVLEAGSDTITLQSADGNVTLTSSGQGDIVLDPYTGIIGLKGTVTVYTGNKIVSSDGNSVQFGNGIAVTGSIVSTVTPLISGSAQIANLGFITSGSNTFQGNQTITGSLYVSSNLVVQGSSSLQDVTGSNVYIGTNKVNLNTNTPGIRFGGISVFDSGSNYGESGSLLWDSQNNRWLYQHPTSSGAPYKSAIIISGPMNSGSLGSESTLTTGKIQKAVGDDHIGDSIITETGGGIGISGSLSITGSITSTDLININSSGINIDRNTSGEPFIFFKKNGTTRASIYGADNAEGLRFFSSQNSFSGSLTVTGSGTFTNGLTVTGSIATNDLILSNESHTTNSVDGTSGSWLIQEGENDLFIINQKTGVKYKFNLTKID